MTRLLLRPDRFAAGGDAIARDEDGRVVFVRGALPGETVEAEIVSEKKDWARAVTVAVIVPSPDRVIPPCPSRRAGCGGCGWQHLTIEAQRAARVDIVSDALRRTGGVAEPEVEHGGGVTPTGYRTTVRVAGTPTAGPGSAPRARTTSWPRRRASIAHPRWPPLLPALRLDHGVEPTLRVSVATGSWRPGGTRSQGDVHGSAGGDAGRSAVTLDEDVAGHRLRVSMGSFFQSGPEAAAEVLVDGRAHAPRRSSPRPGSSSTPTPASGCSRCAPRRRRHG